MKKLLLLIILPTLLFVSCSTPYQEVGTDVRGGYSFERKSQNIFNVLFEGNGFTTPQKASDFAILRAAEVTLEHQFKYFTKLGKKDISTSREIDTGGYATTTGTVSSYGTYTSNTTYTPSSTTIYQPGYLIIIQCYTSKPSGHVGKIYDAKSVQMQLRTQYKLNSL